METTTRAQHTPGPWHDGIAPDPEAVIGSGRIICTTPMGMGNECAPVGERRANRRLIAAAPALLAALEDVVRATSALGVGSWGIYDDIEQYGAEFVAAIARAKQTLAQARGDA